MKQSSKSIGTMVQAIQMRKWMLHDAMTRDELEFLNNLEWELRTLYHTIAQESAQASTDAMLEAQKELIDFYENLIKSGVL